MTPSKRTDPHRRRRQILVAAHRRFSEAGFHETTMQDVADEAGVSVGTLYRYFGGKEALVQGLAEWGREQKGAMLAGLEAGAGPDAVGRALEKILGFLDVEGAERAARLDVRLWGEALGHPALSSVARQGLAGLAGPLAAYLRREKAEGRIRDDTEPEPTARVLVALLLGLELQKALDPEMDVAACAREAARLVEGLAPRG